METTTKNSLTLTFASLIVLEAAIIFFETKQTQMFHVVLLCIVAIVLFVGVLLMKLNQKNKKLSSQRKDITTIFAVLSGCVCFFVGIEILLMWMLKTDPNYDVSDLQQKLDNFGLYQNLMEQKTELEKHKAVLEQQQQNNFDIQRQNEIDKLTQKMAGIMTQAKLVQSFSPPRIN